MHNNSKKIVLDFGFLQVLDIYFTSGAMLHNNFNSLINSNIVPFKIIIPLIMGH